MKEKVFLAISVAFLCCSLSGCNSENKSSEATENPVSENTVADSEKTEDSTNDTQPNGGASESNSEGDNSEVRNNEESVSDSKNSAESNVSSTTSDEVIEGKYPDGKYKLVNSSNEIVVEYSSDDSTSTIKYEFSDGKVSNFSMVERYNDDEAAKKFYEEELKDNDFIKSNYKDVKLNGSEISYVIADNYLSDLKQKSKDEIFKELKDLLPKDE